MKKIALLFFSLLVSVNLFATPPLNFVELGDIKLFSGETLNDCVMAYRILGEANEDQSNYILYPTWHGGTSEHIAGLITKYNFVDTSSYCIIMVDALANGVSTSPSNSKTQHGELFPDIRVIDMARCQKAVLDYLGIEHLHAIVGGSMGSMQGFELITEYPNLADKAVLYVCSPRNSPYDIIRREATLDIIDMGRKYNISPQEYMKSVRLIQSINGKSPEYYSVEMPLTQTQDYINSFNTYKPGLFDQDNFYSQTKALYYHDISWRDGYNIEKTAKRIKTDLFIIVNKQDHTVSPWEAINFAKLVGAKTLVLNNNRGHLGISHEIIRVRKAMNKFLKKKLKKH